MVSFKLWLRRTVESGIPQQSAKFAALKGVITFVSYNCLQQLILTYGEQALIIWTNSAVTQVIEFFTLRHSVFNGHEKQRGTTKRQALRFMVVVAGLGCIEAALLPYFSSRGYGRFAAYVLAHTPTMPLRYVLDRYWVYRESLSPRLRQ